MTEQRPYDPDGEPFPTTYYMTCRHLVAAISRLEAAGGVERWTAAAAADPELAASLERAHAEQRRLRRELAGGRTGRDGGASLDLGVGGAGRTGSLKCLHAHAAIRARPARLPPRRADRRRARPALARPLLHPRRRGDYALLVADSLDLTRHEWEEGHRRLEAQRGDPRRYGRLLGQLELVSGELPKRVGQTYTLA